jgi:hypothetical protein
MTKTENVVQTFLRRVLAAAMLDPSVYEEVEADRTATGQALLVVVLSSVAAGVGARGWHTGASEAILFFAGISVIALLAWAAWALLTFEIGTRLLPTTETRSDVGELLRTLGFASAPGLVRVLGILPGATDPVFIVAAVWMLAAMVIAVRQALDYTSTARALAVCGLGWILSLVLAVVLGLVFGPTLLGA